MAAIILTAFGICTMVPYIILRIKRRHVHAIILKVSTSVFFILSAGASVMAASGAQFEQYKHLFFGILFGQVSGLLGDYWLDMKDMHTKHHDTYVFAGFTSFLIGHLFFIAGLYKTYAAHGAGIGWKQELLIPAAGVLLCAGVLLTEKPMKLKYGKFKGITAGYSFVFGMSIVTPLLVYFATKEPQALIMCIGLVVFLLSDLVLSGTYFGGKTRPIDYTLNYVFYYGGQFTIALSLLAIVGF